MLRLEVAGRLGGGGLPGFEIVLGGRELLGELLQLLVERLLQPPQPLTLRGEQVAEAFTLVAQPVRQGLVLGKGTARGLAGCGAGLSFSPPLFHVIHHRRHRLSRRP